MDAFFRSYDSQGHQYINPSRNEDLNDLRGRAKKIENATDFDDVVNQAGNDWTTLKRAASCLYKLDDNERPERINHLVTASSNMSEEDRVKLLNKIVVKLEDDGLLKNHAERINPIMCQILEAANYHRDTVNEVINSANILPHNNTHDTLIDTLSTKAMEFNEVDMMSTMLRRIDYINDNAKVFSLSMKLTLAILEKNGNQLPDEAKMALEMIGHRLPHNWRLLELATSPSG